MTSATAALRGPLRKRESHLWERDADDHYVEPEWCSERLFAIEPFIGEIIDPACGFGTIIGQARKAHHFGVGWDLVDRGFPLTWQGDFLTATQRVCNFVSNPPFGIARPFAEHALRLARHKVCLLLPANWVQGDKRARWLSTTPLARVWFICPRPSMPPGHIITAGGKPGNGTTDYAWFVWAHGHQGRPELSWLHRDGHPAGGEGGG